MYNTEQAAQKAGVSIPTFRRRIGALGMKPAKRDDDYGTKMWTTEQVDAVKNIKGTCPWCASPYHTRCYLADSAHADERAKHVINSGVEIVQWNDRKDNTQP